MSTINGRFDGIDHWLEFDNKFSRSLCKMPGCKMLTNAICTKCYVHLCFNRNRNCFRRYHLRVENSQIGAQYCDITKSKVTKCKPPAARQKSHRKQKDCFTNVTWPRREVFVKQHHNMTNASKKQKRLQRSFKGNDAGVGQSYSTATMRGRKPAVCEASRRFLRNRLIYSDGGKHFKNTSHTITSSSATINSAPSQNNADTDLKSQFFAYLRLSPK